MKPSARPIPETQSPSDSGCLSENDVVDLLCGAATADQRDQAGAHIDECASCRELLVAFAQSVSAPATPSAPSSTAAKTQLSGASLDRYELVRVIGVGGMGVVYEARDPALDRAIAVKLIRPEYDGSAELDARLARESKAMAKISHPNVVTVHDVGRSNGHLFIAMELVDGDDLSRWLRVRQRTYDEILTVLRSAGRGLAAAHDAAIVHRDFKPQNVLIASSTSAVVTDFGLASAPFYADGRAQDVGAHGASRTAAGGVDLTRAGTIVGTPAYMAPEQHLGRSVDARTDQFSFCVTLFEALYGERPFAGNTREQIAAAVRSGQIRFPRTAPRPVPRRVRRALLRGLSTDPAARFDSMHELLRALSPRRHSTRRYLVAAIAAAVVGASVPLLGAADDDDNSCDRAPDRIDRVWNASRRDTVRAVMVSPGDDPSRLQFEQVEHGLDAFAKRWKSTALARCETQDADVARTQDRCLDLQLTRLDHLTGMLTEPEPGRVPPQVAIAAVGELRRQRSCSASQSDVRDLPEPTDPATLSKVVALRDEIARADVERLAGRYSEALDKLTSLASRAEQLGYDPVVAEVLYFEGVTRSLHDSATEAEATLRKSALAAVASRHDHQAADSWLYLLALATSDLGDFERARDYADQARAAIDRAGSSAWFEGVYYMHLGQLQRAESNFDDALASFRTAADFLEKGDDELDTAMALEGTAVVYDDLGRRRDALAIHERILRTRQRQLRPGHPDLAISETNLATARAGLGDHKRALQHAQRALAIYRAVLDPQHRDIADAHHNLGELLRLSGRFDESLSHHRQAHRIFETLFGGEHQAVATSLEHQGGTLLELGRAREAADLIADAVRVLRARLGDDHFDVARARHNFAIALRETGRLREALEHDRASLESLEDKFGADSMYCAYPLNGIGFTELELGNPARALVRFARAATVMTDADAEATELSNNDFGTARALWALRRDRSRAISLAERALGRYDAASPSRERERIESWLADKRGAR